MEDLPSVGIRLLDERLTGWGFPRWGSAAAAGLDLHACLDAPLTLEPGAPAALIPAGFCVLIRDPAWCGLVFPRSGRGHRDGLILGNGTGVIDADYEGPLMISAWNRSDRPARIEPGERIAQLVFTRVTRPTLTVLDTDEPAGSGRGQGGFGSSGR
ncbi:dUTP diphosphatase [Methylobacterium aerolatum]|uniref:dUTP diphosphatase n=1 Tax=Methylobacterium aerolatum TaxID=418708 RepID=A0ABU0I084_9HYPH|nr:dUTP diphosphatase [Methylobacterium aerolatum]MDQ0448009.1 dUTP pyrophosphatase [Methylobacterium aerolatum]GJD36520.1 Deoxyuridine 5'-triphosphate nucleotidohydrolase [Methylobacterium aerolatum]